MTAILWFQQDLRLADHQGLHDLAKKHKNILPIYLWDVTVPAHETMGAAQKWWLHHSLKSLSSQFQKRYGTPLLFLKGDPVLLLEKIIRAVPNPHLYWTGCYEPHAKVREKRILDHFEKKLPMTISEDQTLVPPSQMWNKAGQPFRVFGAFYKKLQSLVIPHRSFPAPTHLRGIAHPVDGDNLDDWNLCSDHPNWARHFNTVWIPGEKGAHSALHSFIESGLLHYAHQRDIPSSQGTSRLSPHLQLGEISPHRLWMEVNESSVSAPNRIKFLSELAWREFSYHLIFHFPKMIRDDFDPRFKGMHWNGSPSNLLLWQKGQTGYPFVDAGMRELWATGWMHNRVRMVVASFLTKDLHIDWRKGAHWFLDTLVDASLANNTINWQWIAGCGVDAAPYVRIFNPVLQSRTYDPHGEYIRRWVPELASLPTDALHAPWEASLNVLKESNVILGKTYPLPIVDHAIARQEALALYYKRSK